MRYAYCLFDLDGTLFDYDKAESTAIQKTFEDHDVKYSPSYLQEYGRINKQIWLDYESGLITQVELKTERFRRLLETLGIDTDPGRFGIAYLKNLSQGRYLLPGVIPLLELLSKNNIKMYLITNGLKDVQRERLSGSEITKYFIDVFISEEIGAAKPDNAIFDESFRRMGFPEKEDVLLIGDSLSSDIAGGCSYKIDTCWYNPKHLDNNSGCTPIYTIQDITELEKILSL